MTAGIDSGQNITYQAVYPIAGVSQSSQPFRDNFAIIKTAVENLQTKTLTLSGDVTGITLIFDSGVATIAVPTTFSPNPTFTGNAGVVVPIGTTIQRSGTPLAGTFRLNTDVGLLEYFASGTWQSVLSSNSPSENFVQKTGDTMTGNLVMDANIVMGSGFTVNGRHVAVDGMVTDSLSGAGVGIIVSSSAGIFKSVTLSGSGITITNPTGVFGNPTIALSTLSPNPTGTFQSVTVDSFGRVTTGSALTSGMVTTALGYSPILSVTAGANITVNTVGQNATVSAFGPGNSVVVPGGGTVFEVASPIVVSTGASVAYAATDRGKVYIRSYSTGTMTDTLPNPSITGIGNGWTTTIINEDTTNSIAFIATSGSINGGSSLILTPGQSATIGTDGTNWYARINGSSTPTATVMAFAGLTAPNGWIFCYGQAISRAIYAGLFAVISTTFGSGNGSTTFNVPDLRGRVIAGYDSNTFGSFASRLTGATSQGVNAQVFAAAGGEQAHVQVIAELAAHTHTAATVVGGGGGGGGNTVTTGNTGSTGSSAGANVVQPTAVLNYVIKA